MMMANQGTLLKSQLLEEIKSNGFDNQAVLEKLVDFDFPTRKQEEWKYSVPAFSTETYGLGKKEGPASPVLPSHLPENVIRLVFTAGRFNPELSTQSFPDGLEITEGNKALGIKPFQENIFSKLNEATASGFGLHIKAAKNMVIEQPLLLIHCLPESGTSEWLQPSISLEAETNSSLTIAEIHIGNSSSVVNLSNEIRVEKGAKLNWINVQDAGPNTILINQTRASLEADSRMKHLVLSQGQGFVRNNLDIHIQGKGAHADLLGLSLGSEKSHCDHHSFVHHAEENSSSRQLYKGIYAGKSTGVFNGKILVDQIAQKTNAYQSGKNILLSPDARVFAKPQLEIFADDVKCSHGATIGQLDEEPLFYLRSRGLDLATARLLLVRAFASEVLMDIENEPLRHFTEDLAIARLDDITQSL